MPPTWFQKPRERERQKSEGTRLPFASPIFRLHSDLVSAAGGSEGDSEQLGSHLVLIYPWADILTLTNLPCLESSKANLQTQGSFLASPSDLKPYAMSLFHQRG